MAPFLLLKTVDEYSSPNSRHHGDRRVRGVALACCVRRGVRLDADWRSLESKTRWLPTWCCCCCCAAALAVAVAAALAVADVCVVFFFAVLVVVVVVAVVVVVVVVDDVVGPQAAAAAASESRASRLTFLPSLHLSLSLSLSRSQCPGPPLTCSFAGTKWNANFSVDGVTRPETLPSFRLSFFFSPPFSRYPLSRAEGSTRSWNSPFFLTIVRNNSVKKKKN